MKFYLWRLPALLLKLLLVQELSAFIFIPREHCFGELGCIITDGAFSHAIRRPINPTPFSRDTIGTTFTVYSREDTNGTLFSALETDNIIDTSFRADRKTKIIIHGFLDAEGEAFYPAMVEGLLKQGDFNVLTINWKGGSRTHYKQAAVNTRVVGLEIAFLVNWLKTKVNLLTSDVHLIGHSLGAHIAGYAGERITDLARITGLDPAEPYFEGLPPKVRLDPSDAKFVDVIHTDSDPILLLGLGLAQPVGHLDFYPNDGRRQPGCQSPIRASIDVIKQGIDYLDGLTPEQKSLITCSHIRSTQLFTDSLVSQICTYDAYSCDSYLQFLRGSCRTCGKDGSQCAKMGINADQWTGIGDPGKENLKMYLKTGSGPKDFCL